MQQGRCAAARQQSAHSQHAAAVRPLCQGLRLGATYSLLGAAAAAGSDAACSEHLALLVLPLLHGLGCHSLLAGLFMIRLTVDFGQLLAMTKGT